MLDAMSLLDAAPSDSVSSDAVSLYTFLQNSSLAWSPSHAAALIMERLVTVNGFLVRDGRSPLRPADVVGVVGSNRAVVVGAA